MSVKGFSFLPRRPDLTEEQFHHHWSTIHLDHAVRIGRLRRYVQLHRTDPALPGFAASPFDGVPEVWFDTLDDAAALATDPSYTENAGLDEPNFIDVGGMAGLTASEHVRVGGPDLGRDDPAVKGLIAIVGADRDAVGSWVLGPWADAAEDRLAGTFRQVHCVALGPARPGRREFDAASELWWPDAAHLAEDAPALEGLASLLATGPADPARSVSLVGRELRVIWPWRPAPRRPGS